MINARKNVQMEIAEYVVPLNKYGQPTVAINYSNAVRFQYAF